ncbi:uncharacterized protein [Centruroides vittatus]|uniref:uncharacterized protein isoform X2 n=1 Tax=Centruroides vittatus TaxID=120091 RepID=UPI00350F2AC9
MDDLYCNISPSTEYDYHRAMAHHANVTSSSSNSSLQSPMGQLQMMPAGLNLSVNSNQGMQAIISNTVNNNVGHNMMRCSNMYDGSIGCKGIYGGGNKSKAKKPKVNKDGIPAPKRAITAYINFTQWYREEIKKTGRSIPKIGEFGKECANKWNSMKDEDKQPFLDVAAKDRERYRKEMAIFKPAKDTNKPKRPGTAFMLFMADFRKEMAGKEPEGGVAALAKLAGERWRGMSEEDKRPYVEKQNEERVRYEQSMEEYRRKQSTEGVTPLNQTNSLEEQTPDSSDDFDSTVTSDSQTASPSSGSTSSSLNSTSVSQTLSPHPQSSSPLTSISPSTVSNSASPLTTSVALTHNIPSTMSNSLSMNFSDHSLSNYTHEITHTTSAGSTPTSSSTNHTLSSQTMNSIPQSTVSSTNVNNISLPSMANSMALTHEIPSAQTSSLGMNYTDHSLPNYAHSDGMSNFNQSHTQQAMSSSYLSNTGTPYNQVPLPGHYNWT